MSIRKIYYLLPPAARILARKLFYLPHDMVEGLTTKEELVPPKGLIYTGGGDFLKTGKRFLKYFIEYGKLQKEDSVLDIGSGIGRLAIPLRKFLSHQAEYNGYDVMLQGVKWCQKNIRSEYPNFKFHHIELKNDLYRNDGNPATEFTFPLGDASQDFIFLISVFTHLVPEETEHYLKEISRLLKPGKRCFGTFFVLDSQLKESNPKFNFKFRKKNYALMDEKVKSANVAFDKNHLFELCKNLGLHIEHYLPGDWRQDQHKRESSPSNKTSLDFQDILVFRKSLA